MKNIIIMAIFLIALITEESIAQTYKGICYTQKREELKESGLTDKQWSNTTDVIVDKEGIIDFNDMLFFATDDTYIMFLGVPKDLLKEFNLESVLKMTSELYNLDCSPPTLYLYRIDSYNIHFNVYLRNVDDARGFLIQTFIGKSNIE